MRRGRRAAPEAAPQRSMARIPQGQERPPGTSLFDPAAGALAYGGNVLGQLVIPLPPIVAPPPNAEAYAQLGKAIARQWERSQLRQDVANVGNAVRSAWDWIKVHASPPTPKPSALPNFEDPSRAPGEGWEWRGRGTPGTKGNWVNPGTGEKYNPDLAHPPPIGPHYDYTDPTGAKWRVFPDGRILPK